MNTFCRYNPRNCNAIQEARTPSLIPAAVSISIHDNTKFTTSIYKDLQGDFRALLLTQVIPSSQFYVGHSRPNPWAFGYN